MKQSNISSESSQEILKTLVGFPTISSDSNLDMIVFIEDYLREFGIFSQRIENAEKTKSNLFVTIGPIDIPGVMLSGHTDVVPVAGQNWSQDPFKMWEKGNSLFGRGTADMKGFIACILGAIPEVMKMPLKRPLHLAFSYDEEVGCLGVRDMISFLKEANIRPSLCIIGEPTLMNVAISHKGKCAYRVTCTGKEIHSGYAPLGLNAIHMASDLIMELRSLQQELKSNGLQDKRFDVPYSTLHVGTIRGGTALNIVPNKCTFDFELRNLSADNQYRIIERIENAAEDIAGAFKEEFPESAISFEKLADYPGLTTPVESDAVAFVKSLVKTNHHTAINFGTEGGLFQESLDIPVIVCGPGSINEFIEISQLQACDYFIQNLIESLRI